MFTLDTFAQNGVGRVDRPSGLRVDRPRRGSISASRCSRSSPSSPSTSDARRPGSRSNAVRWSETASRTMGLSVLQMKLLVSGLAAFVAGVGGGFYATQQKAAVPSTYATLLGLAWLAVLVTFGVRSNIAALLAAIGFTITPALLLSYTTPTWAQLPVLLFGVGAIMLAKNPEGTVHMQAMQVQQGLRQLGRRAGRARGHRAGRPPRPAVRPTRRGCRAPRSRVRHRPGGRGLQAMSLIEANEVGGAVEQTADARSERRHRSLRRARRAVRRERLRVPRNDRRPRGSERRGQDDAVRSGVRVVAAEHGRGVPRRPAGHEHVRPPSARVSGSRARSSNSSCSWA